MGRADTKASRLLQIEAMLFAHPEGMSQAEIARRLGVHRSTINRYLPDLPKHIYIDVSDDNKWKIDREAYLVHLRLSLHEAMAVHLATRLLASRMERHNPHAAAALRKLGVALEKLAPQISNHLTLSADEMDGRSSHHDPVYLQALEKLTLGWAEGRQVRVWHRHAETGRVHAYNFEPYFIEPYAVGQSTHVIGLREPPGALRTFKIERIERVELLRDRYNIPADFDVRDLLTDAWGIWYTEEEPEDVVLRFHPNVVSRVRETRWHRSEQLAMQEDGGLIWRAKVAEPREMLPWIRGWGADVEVIAPASLRAALLREVQQLAMLYGIGQSNLLRARDLLWAKANRKTDEIHLLIYHLIDVAQVALALWDRVLSKSMKQQLAGLMNLDVASAGTLLAFWIGLHDLGKCSPSFQRKYPPAIARLERMGLPFPPSDSRSAPHGVISAWALESLLSTEAGLEKRLAKCVARAVGGHHGVWPTPDQFWPTGLREADKGGEEWHQARVDLVESLKSVLAPPDDVVFRLNLEKENTLLTLLSGFTSVADWIGSMEDYFPYEGQSLGLDAYALRAASQAQDALQDLGWVGWQSTGEMCLFDEVFPFPPREIQQSVIAEAEDLEPPALVILEAPTGIGKTEAALYLADKWLQSWQGRGIYVAMPTQATSNQMFDRVRGFLKKRYPGDLVNFHLLHSQASSSKGMQEIRLTDIGDEREQGKVVAMSWFLPRKRSLLAPFAVGTVDQALLSVLLTKHFFVRLFGLSHKVVIFDEVHAYDTYMSTIFHRLLNWLREIGTSAIVLSATLPARTRRELVEAYLGKGADVATDSSYPRLTMVCEDNIREIALPSPPEQYVTLEWIPKGAQTITERLTEELKGGGCAAVICNTVKRAQEVYRTIRTAGIVSDEYLLLFHARFPFVWRDEIERKVRALFGKEGNRPAKAILVATQVVEQSLDLDFDLMITDIAPVDLILQRAGRLHRHERSHRPEKLAQARLLIAEPEIKSGIPIFGDDAYIYEQYILLASTLVLRDKDQLCLPRDTDQLIEAVYGSQDWVGSLAKPLQDEFAHAGQKMEDNRRKEIAEAKNRLVRQPNAEDLLAQPNQSLEEDNAEIHQAFQALTRLMEPGISLVCLHWTEQGLALEPDGQEETLNLDDELSAEQIGQLLQRTVTVRHGGVLSALLAQKPPKNWEVVAALRHHRLAVFRGGLCHLERTPYTLRLSRDMGLEIDKEES